MEPSPAAGFRALCCLIIALTIGLEPARAQSVVRLPPVNDAHSQATDLNANGTVQRVSAVAPWTQADAFPGEPHTVPETLPSPPALSPDEAARPVGGQDRATKRVIDLPTSFRLAFRINPEIGIVQEAILEALALQQGARVLLLPSITGGTNYHLHHGNLQRGTGAILGLSEQALYFGGGARTVAAQTVAFPAIRIFSHLGDAVFEPLAAQQEVQVRRFDAGAKENSVLLSVSTRYMELMGAEARVEVLEASRRDAAEVVRITTSFARAGQARQADADRVTTEASLIDSEIQQAVEQVAVAAAELARLLNLDPSLELRTVGGPIPVLVLVDPQYSLAQLLDVAMRRRPELGARASQVSENEIRYRQERTRPLLPTISVGFSAGAFGGGSNLTDPIFGSFAGRTDFDVAAFWTLQNFGIGNRALWQNRRAQTDQATMARIRTLNLVRQEVADAYARSTAGRQEIVILEKRLAVAEAGFQEEFARIRGGQGLPIELLDNLTRLITAREALVAAIAGYDQAQFRLFVALGQPPTFALPNLQALGDEPGP